MELESASGILQVINRTGAECGYSISQEVIEPTTVTRRVSFYAQLNGLSAQPIDA